MARPKIKWYCNYCPRQFNTDSGRNRHAATCKQRFAAVINTSEQPSLFPIRETAMSEVFAAPYGVANSVQHGGTHYQDGAGCCPHCGKQIQHWDIVRMFNMDYFIGNATKYLFRLGLKGEAKEQINKAIHYLQKKMESL